MNINSLSLTCSFPTPFDEGKVHDFNIALYTSLFSFPLWLMLFVSYVRAVSLQDHEDICLFFSSRSYIIYHSYLGL